MLFVQPALMQILNQDLWCRILMTASPRLEESSVPALRGSWEESERSWSSYLGLSPVTVLRTLTQLVTARAASPAAMVTFSVRGCQPSHLPFGLPLCSEPNNTATATARISSTKDVHYVEEQPDAYPSLHSSILKRNPI